MEYIAVVGTLIGGIGLFLLAIGMMTDGLKLAAGPSLRKILSDWSDTPQKGIFSGFLMTAIVQSSSAVTVASIGFVNAGLLNLRQALGIIYGSNVGTTVTGWLVALVGFKFNIQAFALPMIGIGMLARLIRPNGRAANLGLALVGFGLFFVGLDVLKGAFEGLVQTLDITQFAAEGITGIFSFLVIGFIMTILTQSSSAAIALTITAATSGMIGIYAAAAMVIGANVGTTSTAALASIGATSNAKRVAAAQVIFNLMTAIIALVTLPLLFLAIKYMSSLFGLEPIPSITLALFHTVFNVLGVLLIFPLNDRLVAFLEKRFLSWEEKASHPRFLDKTLGATPVLAVNALVLEVQEITERIARLCRQALKGGHGGTQTSFDQETEVIKNLSSEVSRFIVSIESSALSEETTNQLATLMRIEQYYRECTHLAVKLSASLNHRKELGVPSLEQSSQSFYTQVADFIDAGNMAPDISDEQFDQQHLLLHAGHKQLKSRLLLAGTRAQIPVNQMSQELDLIAESKELAKNWYKAIKRIKPLQRELNQAGETRAQ